MIRLEAGIRRPVGGKIDSLFSVDESSLKEKPWPSNLGGG